MSCVSLDIMTAQNNEEIYGSSLLFLAKSSDMISSDIISSDIISSELGLYHFEEGCLPVHNIL